MIGVPMEVAGLIYCVAIIVSLVIAVVFAAVIKRQSRRLKINFGIRHELIKLLEDVQTLLYAVKEPDLNSLDELTHLRDRLEDMLIRLDQVEQLYGKALAQGDTDSDPHILTGLIRARGTIITTLDYVRSIMSRLKTDLVQ